MLDENAFVDFWGRLKKMKEGGEGEMKVEVGAEDLAGEGEGDGDEGGGVAVLDDIGRGCALCPKISPAVGIVDPDFRQLHLSTT